MGLWDKVLAFGKNLVLRWPIALVLTAIVLTAL
jgi:hypothetical protein